MDKKKVIEYETSSLKAAQELTNKLADKLGQPTYTWQNLENNVSLAESLQGLANALKELERYHKTESCNSTHFSGDRSSRTSTYNGCSGNHSSVKGRVCEGNYDFGECNTYDKECTARVT